MKAIFVSAQSDFSDQIKNSLGNNNIAVSYIDERKNIFPPIQSRMIWKIIRRVNLLRKFNNFLLNKKLLNMAEKEQPDFILVNKGTTIKDQTLKKINALGLKLINWFPENSENEPYKSWVAKNSVSYDYFFSFDSSIEKLNRSDIKTRYVYLPFGVDLSRFENIKINKDDVKKYSAELCFIGAYYPEREKILKYLTGYDLKIFGWKGWEKSSLASFYCGPLNLIESIKAYKLSKISININTTPPVNGVNFKTFEICAAGGFQITDRRKDINNLFKIGEELDIFEDIGDLNEKIKFYLKNDDIRNKIAQKGQDRIRTEHLMDMRIKRILYIINK